HCARAFCTTEPRSRTSRRSSTSCARLALASPPPEPAPPSWRATPPGRETCHACCIAFFPIPSLAWREREEPDEETSDSPDAARPTLAAGRSGRGGGGGSLGTGSNRLLDAGGASLVVHERGDDYIVTDPFGELGAADRLRRDQRAALTAGRCTQFSAFFPRPAL